MPTQQCKNITPTKNFDKILQYMKLSILKVSLTFSFVPCNLEWNTALAVVKMRPENNAGLYGI